MALPDNSNGIFLPTPIRSSFLRLPRELRDQIYLLVLLEAPKWTKRHSAFCSLSDRLGTSPEQPPCTLFTNEYDVAGRLKKVPQCRCARRQSLGLLLANRQIHAEAAPIFWRNNLLCFDDPQTFDEDVGKVLRQEYRDCIQHISIMPPAYGMETRCSGNVWPTVFACKNLRSIELRPECVVQYSADFENIPRCLLHLKSLTLVHLQIYDLAQPQLQSALWADFTAADRQSIYVKIAQSISTELTQDGLRNAVRDFRTNFYVHVDYQVKKDFFDQPLPPAWGVPAENPVLLATLRDDNSNPAITLRDGTTVTLSIYGLPKSRTTRLRQSRERRAHEARLKAAGLPSTEEMKLALHVKAAKEKKKQKEEQREREERSKTNRTLEKKKNEYRRQQEEEEMKLKVNQEARLRRKTRKAEAVKKEERKRVPKKV